MLSLPLAFILSQDQTLHRILLSPDKSVLFIYVTEALVVFSNLSILLLLFFCLKISLKTAVNSICLGTCSSVLIDSFNTHCASLEAGAKVQLLFLTGKKFLKFFLEKFYLHLLLLFLSVCQGTLLFLRGANVTSVF